VIVREEAGHLVLVRQSDHALLSGWLAAAWGAPPWTAPPARAAAVVAARLHDLAWTAFDEGLPRRPDGRPLTFFEVARTVSTRLYAHGIDAVEAIDPHAGLLTSLHFSGFFTSHWGWRHAGQAIATEDEDGAAVARFVEQERVRQSRLRDSLGVDPAGEAVLRCEYRWLQLWDRLSLDVCMRGFHGWTGYYQEAALSPEPGAPDVSLHVELEPGGVCRLAPYPLVLSPYRARVPAVHVPLADLADAAAVERAWREGGSDGVDVTFRPG